MAIELEPGGALPARDESGNRQVELYVVLDGEAVIVIDGEEHAAPAGTFASIEPDSERTLLNRSSAPVTALLFGAVPGPGYQPPSWALSRHAGPAQTSEIFRFHAGGPCL